MQETEYKIVWNEWQQLIEINMLFISLCNISSLSLLFHDLRHFLEDYIGHPYTTILSSIL
jgi:hypothetical protein